jgi:hypothetical protein
MSDQIPNNEPLLFCPTGPAVASRGAHASATLCPSRGSPSQCNSRVPALPAVPATWPGRLPLDEPPKDRCICWSLWGRFDTRRSLYSRAVINSGGRRSEAAFV